MSRVGSRAGTKVLRCMECQRRIGSSSKGGGLLFRGNPRGFRRHMRKVHGKTI